MAPVARAQDESPVPKGIGISLREAPVERRDDPRALAYVVDHLNPGSMIRRRIEVSNGTEARERLDVYAAAADIEGGGFRILDGRAENELTGWITVEPAEVTLDPGARASATVTIEVPTDAEDGERYAAVVAELPPKQGAGQVAIGARVGIRVYLSVGDGGEPASDFAIDSLAAGRDDEGRPVVRAAATNTGGRAVDLQGDLELLEGPGGVTAGPFPAEVPATLAPGDSAPVTVLLDEDLPAGPWLARVTLRSGELERRAEATITFPDEPGTFDDPVDAEDVAKKRRLFVPIAAALLAIVLVALAATVWNRRHRRPADVV